MTLKKKLQHLILFITSVSFISVGILHFTHASIFVSIMPAYLPWHLELVWLSGIFEILGGLGILIPSTRRFSAWGLLALLIAVFPANINMAMNTIFIESFSVRDPIWLWIRLPFQFVIAAQVWFAGLCQLEES